jgi:hypothetical protein
VTGWLDSEGRPGVRPFFREVLWQRLRCPDCTANDIDLQVRGRRSEILERVKEVDALLWAIRALEGRGGGSGGAGTGG